MNPWQAAQQIAAALRAATWPDSPAGAVFGAVVVTTPENYETNQEARLPVARLLPAGEQPDPEIPDRIVFAFEVAVIAEVVQEKHGAYSILGGSRAGGLGSSSGRGCLELEEIARGVLLGPAATIDPRLRLNARATAGRTVEVVDAEHRQLAARVFEVEMTGSRQRFYHPVRSLALSNAGSHRVTVFYRDPPVRWDTLGGAGGSAVIAVVYKAGSTPPASVSDGTVSYHPLGATSGGGFNVNTTAGTWSFSVFVQYDENGDGTADRWSAAATGTITV